MTVQELITVLQQFDPTTTVLVEGYEGGYEEIGDIKECEFDFDPEVPWWYGRYTVSEGEGIRGIILDRWTVE